ncbi:uncharacterized protein LOC141914245 [Tubulanus polymorphus]|uniref:uncharacterized protein LOC141914245 n=1 Tax=Tubulanus polymorphus TaxID=672921 RepID=UPI003DA36A3C
MATEVLLVLVLVLVVYFGSIRVKATTCYGSSCNNIKWAKHCNPGQAPVTQTPGVELTCPDNAECDAGWNGPGCQIGNVARDKQATSSSVFTHTLYGADKCVDGLISSGGEEGLCHTKNETDAWFQVDLDGQHVVLGVDLYDRSDATDCDNNPVNSWKRRSRNLEVRVGNNTASTDAGVPGSNVKCGYHGPALCGGHVFIRCSTPLIGRYVTVQHHGIGKREFFGLAEVEVRGYVYTAKSDCSKPASFGCMGECRCDGNAPCDYLSGTCSTGCSPNYIGHSCEQEFKWTSPSTPTTISTENGITINWPAYSGSVVDSGRGKITVYYDVWYIVGLKKVDGSLPWVHVRITSQPQIQITGLTQNTNYTVAVYLHKYQGDSMVSKSGLLVKLVSNAKTTCGGPVTIYGFGSLEMQFKVN